VAHHLVESVVPFYLTTQLVPLLPQGPLLVLHLVAEPHRLPDEVGHHLQEAGLLLETLTRRRLRGEHTDRPLLPDADGHPDEGQAAVVEAQPVEEPWLVPQPGQDPGLVALQDAPNHPLAGAIAHGGKRHWLRLVKRAHQELPGLRVHQTDHAVVQPIALVQDFQHLGQGLAQVERAAQHAADLVEGAQLRLQLADVAGFQG
jgi:hypothetical protein